MNKFITLMRHGEANGSPDIDRQLTEIGRQQCRLVAEGLAAQNILPDFVVCSGVDRTRQTLAAMELSPSIPVLFCGEDLYQARSYRDVLQVIGDYVPNSGRHPLIIGHNPTIHETACYLARESRNMALVRQISSRYDPSTASHFEFSGESWDMLHPALSQIRAVLNGQDLT